MNINGIFDHRVHSIHSILRCFHPTSTNFSEYKKKLMSLKSSFWCDHSQGWIGLMRVWEFLCISNNSTVHTYRYLHTLWGKKKFLLHGKHVMILNPRGQIQTYSIYCSDLIWSGLELTGAKPDVCESVCVCVWYRDDFMWWLRVQMQRSNIWFSFFCFCASFNFHLLICLTLFSLTLSPSWPSSILFFFFLLPVSICWGIWPLVCFKAGKIIL